MKRSSTFRAIEKIRSRGLARNIGVSLRDFRDARLVLDWADCSVVELILNMLDQRPIDSGTLKLLEDRQIEVVARLPVAPEAQMREILRRLRPYL